MLCIDNDVISSFDDDVSKQVQLLLWQQASKCQEAGNTIVGCNIQLSEPEPIKRKTFAQEEIQVLLNKEIIL